MADIFSNSAVIWFIVGFIFFLLEFAIPGLVLFFFAIGAWLISGLCLITDFSINKQLLIFIISSVLFLLLFRNWLKTKVWVQKLSNEVIDDEFIGKTAKAETNFIPGERGKVEFKGTSWDAVSDEVIQKGNYVTIIGNESIVLKVKSSKSSKS